MTTRLTRASRARHLRALAERITDDLLYSEVFKKHATHLVREREDHLYMGAMKRKTIIDRIIRSVEHSGLEVQRAGPK